MREGESTGPGNSPKGGAMGTDLGERIRSIVAEQLGVDLAEIRPDSSILDDLCADSLEIVELMMVLEDEFEIEVSDAAAEAIRTVADVERYVSEHVS
jgi:acyl carrier protein